MRGSTKLAIGCVVGWFLLNLIAGAQAPTSLNDPDFGSRVAVGSGLQSLGGMVLLIGIIAIIVTIYLKSDEFFGVFLRSCPSGDGRPPTAR
jgi:hypothetical protein